MHFMEHQLSHDLEWYIKKQESSETGYAPRTSACYKMYEININSLLSS